MNKLLVLAGFMLVINFSGKAQSIKKPVRFGVKGSINFSNIVKNDKNNNFETSYLTGYNFGVTVDLRLLSNLAFTPELLYSTKGYQLKSSAGNRSTTTTFIDLPFLLTANVGNSINLAFGLQFSYLIKTTNSFKSGFVTMQEKTVEDDSNRFKKSLLGWLIGFRYDINKNVNFYGRYALDFQKNNAHGSTTTPEFKNQVFSLGLGYRF